MDTVLESKERSS